MEQGGKLPFEPAAVAWRVLKAWRGCEAFGMRQGRTSRQIGFDICGIFGAITSPISDAKDNNSLSPSRQHWAIS